MDFKTPNRRDYTGYTGHKRAQVASSPPASSKKQISVSLPSKKWWRPLLGLVIIALLVWLAHGYITTNKQLTSLKNPKTASVNQGQQLIDQIGKLVQLPQNETPTIATVHDATKLKSQAFFANAQNGDKVLIYTKSNQAVLYRPSTNKIIEFSTVNLQNSSNQ